MITECRLCESYTHEKTGIYTSIERYISPECMTVKVTTCIGREEIFLASIFCISLYDKFSIISGYISTATDTRYYIGYKLILISTREVIIIQMRNIEETKRIYRITIFPYFEMQMSSCRHRSSTWGSRSTSASCYTITLADKLIWIDEYI